MTVETDAPQQTTRFVDDQGRLTLDGVILLQKIKAALDDHEARLVADGL